MISNKEVLQGSARVIKLQVGDLCLNIFETRKKSSAGNDYPNYSVTGDSRVFIKKRPITTISYKKTTVENIIEDTRVQGAIFK